MRGTFANCAAVVAASASALLACSSTAAALPTHDLLNGGHAVPTGLINGTLVARAECVYVQNAPNSPVLVIWPRGFDRIGQQIAQRGNPVAQVGEFVTIYGGSIDALQYERVRPTIGGSAIPPDCATDDYWMALRVEHPADD